MPAYLKRAQLIEDELNRRAQRSHGRVFGHVPMENAVSIMAASGMSSHEVARAFGAKWTCSYCGARNGGERCACCGAEEVCL